MTRQHAKLVVLKVGNGGSPESFTAIGGMQMTRLHIRRGVVAASHAGDGGWRPALAASGERQISISGQGEFTDSAAEETLRTHAFSGAVVNYQIDFGVGGKVTVPCVVASFERLAEMRDVLSYRLTLESAGAAIYVDA